MVKWMTFQQIWIIVMLQLHCIDIVYLLQKLGPGSVDLAVQAAVW